MYTSVRHISLLALLLNLHARCCCQGAELTIGHQPTQSLQDSYQGTAITSQTGHTFNEQNSQEHGRKLQQGGDLVSIVTWGPNTTGLPDKLADVSQIVGGNYHYLVLYGNGSVQAFNDSSKGDKWNQDTVPAGVRAGKAVLVAARYSMSAVIMDDGQVFGFGEDSNNTDYVLTAVNRKMLLDIQDFQFGWNFVVALFRNGTVMTVGGNDYGQLDIPAGINGQVTAIAAGRYHNLFLLSNGSVQACGDVKGYGAVPDTIGNQAVAIAAGDFHSVVLLKNGTVVLFGDNEYNQMDMPADTTNVGAISCGRLFTLALQQGTGRVFAWGDNNFNDRAPLNVPLSAQSKVVNISTGGYTGIAVKSSLNAVLPPSTYPSPSSSTQGPLPPLLATQPPVPSPKPDATKAISNGAVAGIAVAGTAVVVAMIGLGLWLMLLRSRRHQPDDNGTDAYAKMVQKMAEIPGLAKGEPFTLSTAHNYVWTTSHPNIEHTAVVAGENDHYLDSMSVSGSAGPAVQLTQQQLKEQVQLLRDGLLGRGATALVFKCLWPSRFGKTSMLAAKVLKDGVELSMAALDAFCYEARLLASLDHHNNVVRLYGYCLDPPTVCLIMEVLPFSLKSILYQQPVVGNASKSGTTDKSLSAAGQSSNATSTAFVSSSSDSNASTVYLTIPGEASSPVPQQTVTQATDTGNAAPNSNLNMQRVLEICIDIAAGLRYLHDTPLAAELEQHTALEAVSELSEPTSSQTVTRTQKIVHRDLKPANILVTASGRAKITDFGLARPHTRTTMSDLNFLAAGTLPYMAPELLVTRHIGGACFPPTNRIDIYSMGMMMWELLAGCNPWSHMGETALIASVLGGRRPFLPVMKTQNSTPVDKPKRLSEMPASVDALPELNEIIRMCWAQKEHRRLSAKDLHDKLVALHDKYMDGVN